MKESSSNSYNFFSMIDKIVDANIISHAYIIQVNNYAEDFLLIKNFVKLLLCKEKKKYNDLLSCNKCNLCSLVDLNNYPDLCIIEPDGKDIKKQQLLSLQKEFQNKSMFDNKRIYILKEADKLNEFAANAILKFLEEPSDNIIAILVTVNRYKLPETILSRCQVLNINSIINDVLYNDEIINLIKFICDGESLFINYNYIYESILFDKIAARDKLKIIEKIFIEYLTFKNNDEIGKILLIVSNDIIIRFILIIERYLKMLEYNVNYKLWLDSFFASLLGGEIDV